MFLRSVVILGQSDGCDPQVALAGLWALLVLSVGWPQTDDQRARVTAILDRAAALGVEVEVRLVYDADEALDTLEPGDQVLNAIPAPVAAERGAPMATTE